MPTGVNRYEKEGRTWGLTLIWAADIAFYMSKILCSVAVLLTFLTHARGDDSCQTDLTAQNNFSLTVKVWNSRKTKLLFEQKYETYRGSYMSSLFPPGDATPFAIEEQDLTIDRSPFRSLRDIAAAMAEPHSLVGLVIAFTVNAEPMRKGEPGSAGAKIYRRYLHEPERDELLAEAELSGEASAEKTVYPYLFEFKSQYSN